MRKIGLGILFLCMAVLHAETNATMLYDGGPNALLVDKTTFYVNVNDEVTGGCLPKPDQLKRSMVSSLKKNGFSIAEDNKNPFIPEVQVTALGFRINGMCVVDLSVNIYFPVIVQVPHAENVPSGNKTYVNYNYYIGRHIFNYRRSQMQNQLNKTVRSYGDKIYMRVSRAKDNIFKLFPSIEASLKESGN